MSLANIRKEIILHTLQENGVDVESLEAYIRDDIERLGSKLNQTSERMRSHLADLLVSSCLRIMI